MIFCATIFENVSVTVASPEERQLGTLQKCNFELLHSTFDYSKTSYTGFSSIMQHSIQKVAITMVLKFNSYLEKISCLLSFGSSNVLGLQRQGINNNLQTKYMKFKADYDSSASSRKCLQVQTTRQLDMDQAVFMKFPLRSNGTHFWPEQSKKFLNLKFQLRQTKYMKEAAAQLLHCKSSI